MSNQVTVRFESTPEVSNNRTYYEKIIPFIKTKDTKPQENKEYFIIDPDDNIYKKIDVTIFSDSEIYYERNYKFLKGEIYCIYNSETETYETIQNTTEINASLQYFIENNVFLISGPVEVFATVDVLYSTEIDETTGNMVEIAHPTSEEMKNPEYFSDDGIFDISIYMIKNPTIKIGLHSPFVTELVKSDEMFTNKNNYIIFVEDVTYDLDSQTHRGAYYYYTGCIETHEKELEAQWTEILLGTHSHTNPDKLEELSNLTPLEGKDKSIIVIKSDGSFSTIEYSETDPRKVLPDLPLDYQEKLEKLEKVNSLLEPVDSDSHHLDAPLELLDDAYDYIHYDENGNCVNPDKLPIGNCRELYRNLIKDNKKVFINKKLDISIDEGDIWVQLESITVNFDTTKRIDDGLNAEISPQNPNQYLLTVDFKWPVLTTDKTIIFVGNGEYYILKPELDYSLISADYKTATLLINKASIVNELTTNFTFLFLRYDSSIVDDSYIMDLYTNLLENSNILNEINRKLLEQYVNGYFDKKPDLKPLYLTTDEYGKITWTNKLLPTQTFYYDTQEITSSNIIEGTEKFKLVFKDVNYKINEDFPILMLDDLFLFDVKPQISESGKDLIYELDLEGNHYSIRISDDPLEILGVANLLVVKSTSSIVDNFDNHYLTREEALQLMSYGKINLADYATKADLNNLARASHAHPQYALKGHNHDYLYANYKHTHPEITTLIASIIQFNEKNFDDIKEWMDSWLNEIELKNKELFDKLIDSLGLKKINNNYYITDENILIKESNDLAERINAILLENKIDAPLDTVNDIHLYDILDRFVRIFENKQITADKVKLKEDLPIFLQNGAIGGLDEAKAKSKKNMYSKDTPIEDILRDIINPSDSLYEVREILTPSKEFTKIKFYTISTDDRNAETPVLIEDPSKIRQNYTGTLLFKIEAKNKYGNNCNYKFIDRANNNTESTLKVNILVNNYEKYNTNSEFYVYDSSFNSNNINYKKDPIEIYWNDMEIRNHNSQLVGRLIDKDDIPDSFEINIFEEKDERFKTGDIILTREYPAYYIGSVNSLLNVQNIINDNFIAYYENSKQKINLVNNKYIVFALRYDLEDKAKLLDKNSGNVLPFFLDYDGTVQLNGYNYILYYYKVSANINDLDLSVIID